MTYFVVAESVRNAVLKHIFPRCQMLLTVVDKPTMTELIARSLSHRVKRRVVSQEPLWQCSRDRCSCDTWPCDMYLCDRYLCDRWPRDRCSCDHVTGTCVMWQVPLWQVPMWQVPEWHVPVWQVFMWQLHVTGFTDWVKVLYPTRHKIGHFGDILPSQSLGLVPKINCNTQYNCRKAKSNQQTTVRSVHMCVCALHCARMLHTILHRTDLIIFPLILQTIIIAQMLSIWRTCEWCDRCLISPYKNINYFNKCSSTYVKAFCGSWRVSFNLPASLTDASCRSTWWTGLKALKSYTESLAHSPSQFTHNKSRQLHWYQQTNSQLTTENTQTHIRLTASFPGQRG